MRPAYQHDIRYSQRNREPGVLIGVRSICRYVQIGPQTFYKLHTEHDFPATRLPDGRWCTSRNLIDEWIIRRWKEQKAASQHGEGSRFHLQAMTHSEGQRQVQQPGGNGAYEYE
jgi:hypothetical protein